MVEQRRAGDQLEHRGRGRGRVERVVERLGLRARVADVCEHLARLRLDGDHPRVGHLVAVEQVRDEASSEGSSVSTARCSAASGAMQLAVLEHALAWVEARASSSLARGRAWRRGVGRAARLGRGAASAEPMPSESAPEAEASPRTKQRETVR